jgi:hypothetical protein
MKPDYFALAHSCLRKADGNKDSALALMTAQLMSDVELARTMIREQCSYFVWCANCEAHDDDEVSELVDPEDLIKLGLTGQWP